MTITTKESIITEHEAAQVKRANASGATPVVFVHGLWLLPSSWDRWVTVFEDAGYVTVTPGWPDDPESILKSWRARGSARSPITRRRSSAAWIGSP